MQTCTLFVLLTSHKHAERGDEPTETLKQHVLAHWEGAVGGATAVVISNYMVQLNSPSWLQKVPFTGHLCYIHPITLSL